MPNDNKHFWINSNLDFMPIACKEEGKLGEGVTRQLEGIKVMLNGVEDKSGFQPANIGSSEGMLDEHVTFDQTGTPKSSDIILHFDFLFEEGEGRTAEGIQADHELADKVLNEIRAVMKDAPVSHFEDFIMTSRVKCASDWSRSVQVSATCMTPCEVLDGAIHSLL